MSAQRKVLLGVVLLLAGCSSTQAPTVPVTPPPSPIVASSARSAVPSSAPSSTTPPYMGIDRGLVMVKCETRGGEQHIDATLLDSDTGVVSRTVTFRLPSDGTDYRSNAKCGSDGQRTGFNQDFSRLFVSREESAEAVSLGYLSPEPGGKFTSLTAKPDDEFTAVKNGVPSYHTGTGLIFSCDNAQSPAKLMSRTINGLDVKVADELQESLSGGVCVDPIMADTKLPTVKVPEVLYDRQGTKSVKVTGKSGNRSFTVSENGREKVYKLSTSDFPGRDLTLVGFLDEVAVVFTDSQKIYLATLSQSTGQVSILLNNTVKENKLVDVMLSEDGSRIAFVAERDSVRKLYSLFLETEERKELAVLDKDSRILQFN